MDGNGRWATGRGLPRVGGHRAGARAVRRAVKGAPELGVGTLSLFAFSSDNWQRPAAEVDALMHLLRTFLRREREGLQENGVRLEVFGRRDRLAPKVLRAIRATEEATAAGTTLRLRLAVDYSGRDAILHAARRLAPAGPRHREEFADALGTAAGPAPDLDLLIRTGGEKRLSDFLLWEAAYAELVFMPLLWPDFTAADLAAAVEDFHGRERRFGRVPGVVAAAGP